MFAREPGHTLWHRIDTLSGRRGLTHHHTRRGHAILQQSRLVDNIAVLALLLPPRALVVAKGLPLLLASLARLQLGTPFALGFAIDLGRVVGRRVGGMRGIALEIDTVLVALIVLFIQLAGMAGRLALLAVWTLPLHESNEIDIVCRMETETSWQVLEQTNQNELTLTRLN